jgi:hypothetical protein
MMIVGLQSLSRVGWPFGDFEQACRKTGYLRKEKSWAPAAALSAEGMRAALSSRAGAPALLQRTLPGVGEVLVTVEGATTISGDGGGPTETERSNNMKVVDGRLQHELGFAGLRPRGSAFRRALDEALHQMQEFLELRQRPEKGSRRMPSAVASR